MIIKEFFETREEDGVNLFKTYSDEGVKIRKVGTSEVYDRAIDVEGAPFTYEETDEKIVTEEERQAQREAIVAARAGAAEENTETETE